MSISVFEKHFWKEDFSTVGDLFFGKVNRGLSAIDQFKLMGLIVYLTQSFKRQNVTINNTGTKLLQKAVKKEQKLLLLI